MTINHLNFPESESDFYGSFYGSFTDSFETDGAPMQELFNFNRLCLGPG